MVAVRVHESGGTVAARFTLDRDAVAVLGGVVAEQTQTSDLRTAGWDISPVEPVDGGGARIEVSKDFSRPEDLAVVIGELAGPAGPLQDFSLERRRSFMKATYRVRGTADLGPGAAAVTGFGNTPDLDARLRDAGVDPRRVAELLAGRAVEGFHLRVDVDLPGESATFEVRPGEAQAIDVSSSVSDRTRPGLLAVAVLAGLIVLARLRHRADKPDEAGPGALP